MSSDIFQFSSNEEHQYSSNTDTPVVEDGDTTIEDNDQKEPIVKRIKRSGIWAHFSEVDNKCLHCSKSLKIKGECNGATSNLWRHLETHHFEEFLKEKPTKFTQFNQDRFNNALAKWIVVDDQPFTTIENISFRDMIRILNPDVKLNSADKLRNDIEKLFLQERTKMIKKFEDNKSKFSFTLDLWTSSNGLSILGITIHYLNSNWEINNNILSFKNLEGQHTGENVCKSFLEVLNEYRIPFSKIMGITCDNASNNSTFMDDLKDESYSITDDTRIRCFPNIINLAVQLFFKTLRSTASDENENENGTSLLVENIRAIVKHIRDSPQREQKFLKICKNEDLNELHVIQDVKTRWNSTYEMIKRCLYLKKAISSYLISERQNEMVIPDEDWNKLEILVKVLEKFNVATKLSSGSSYPSIASTLALKIWLKKTLINYGKEYTSLEDAISKSIEKIDEYTGIFTESKLLILAMILNPSLKLMYAKKNGWTNKELKHSQDILKKIYQEYDDSALFQLSDSSIEGSQSFLDDVNKTCTSKKDEISKYLSETPCDPKSNIFLWWKANESNFPILSKIALDLLAVSGSAVPVERSFSGGVDLITVTRNKLSPDSINICTCLKDWLKTKV